MRHLALSALAGVLAALASRHAPLVPAVVAALLALTAARRCPSLRLPAAFLCGFVWGAWAASSAMDARLPLALEGEVVAVGGRVLEFPLADGPSLSLVLDDLAAPAAGPPGLPSRLVVRWYAAGYRPRPGDWCELHIRLERARGLANPGGRDLERNFLARHLAARGQVVGHPGNLCLAIATRYGVSHARGVISAAIDAAVPSRATAAVLRALTVDDRSGLSDAQWAVMRATGTSHLLSISGLHISIVALGAFALCRVAAAVCGLRRQGYPAIRVSAGTARSWRRCSMPPWPGSACRSRAPRSW